MSEVDEESAFRFVISCAAIPSQWNFSNHWYAAASDLFFILRVPHLRILKVGPAPLLGPCTPIGAAPHAQRQRLSFRAFTIRKHWDRAARDLLFSLLGQELKRANNPAVRNFYLHVIDQTGRAEACGHQDHA